MGMDALMLVRLVISGVLVAGGLVCIAGGALGVWRFPDFYTRLHGQRVADAVGAVLVLIGLAVAAEDVRMATKLGLLAVLAIAVSPLVAHLNAHAAHAAGLAPLAGPYAAPRPDARDIKKDAER